MPPLTQKITVSQGYIILLKLLGPCHNDTRLRPRGTLTSPYAMLCRVHHSACSLRLGRLPSWESSSRAVALRCSVEFWAILQKSGHETVSFERLHKHLLTVVNLAVNTSAYDPVMCERIACRLGVSGGSKLPGCVRVTSPIEKLLTEQKSVRYARYRDDGDFFTNVTAVLPLSGLKGGDKGAYSGSREPFLTLAWGSRTRETPTPPHNSV
jgi:hypothetical protein